MSGKQFKRGDLVRHRASDEQGVVLRYEYQDLPGIYPLQVLLSMDADRMIEVPEVCLELVMVRRIR